ncbi:MAG: hypothetical protein ACTHOU_19120 [Aureliella sp.]
MSLSFSLSKSRARLTAFEFPFRRLAAGLGLAIGLLAPSIYELTQRPAARNSHLPLERSALIVLALTLVAIRIARWRFERSPERVRWWALDIRGLRRGALRLRAEGAEPEYNSPPFSLTIRHGRPVAHLDDEPGTMDVPLPRQPAESQSRLAALNAFFSGAELPAGIGESHRATALKFSMLSLFALTTAVAVVVAFGKYVPRETALVVIPGLLLGLTIASAWLLSDERSRIQATFLALYFPYAWIITFDWPRFASYETLTFFPVSPAIVPALLVFGGHPDGNIGLLIAVAVSEILLAAWLARRGPIWAMVTLACILSASTFFSFVLHALFRF